MCAFFTKQRILFTLILVAVYLSTHLYGLLELPVFADEAIYIRWAQLLIDDFSRYLFFPMNDGKTPLFFWILAPFQFLFDNQLYAARFVSVLVGLIQMFVVMQITALLTKNFKTVYLSGMLVIALPFWYFHHRMALTDGLLTLFVSVSMLFLITEFTQKVSKPKLQKIGVISQVFTTKTIKNVLLAGFFLGLALYTKIPAILFVPSLFLLVFLVRDHSKHTLLVAAVKVLIAVGISLVLFSFLAFAPAFSQLFGRGSDFLFSLDEIFSGRWKETVPSLPVYLGYFVSYLTPTFALLLLSGLFAKKNKIPIHVFFWSGILFIVPIWLMGKVVYARYLFPAVIPFTLAGVFAIEELVLWAKTVSSNLAVKFALLTVTVLLVSNTAAHAGIFMTSALTDHTQIPFVSSDSVQYLTEWSSGHGIYEVAELIKLESKTHSIAVATEGSFGTLPDGLNLYFHTEDVSNIAIDGMGYPLTGISQQFAQATENFDRKWLVVNSHRMNLELDPQFLLKEYCRPFAGPCLQVWDITSVFEELILD